jgi:hypothetical protein
MSNIIDDLVQILFETEDDLRYLYVCGLPKAEVQERIRSAVKQWQKKENK